MEVTNDQQVYPMRKVVEATGVNPHKLRFWEDYHGLLSPGRTAKGHRLYSLEDIHRIKEIAVMVEKRGFSPGAIKKVLAEKSAVA